MRRRPPPLGEDPAARPAAGERPSRALAPLIGIAFALALFHVASVSAISISRFAYPFELEWLEGAVLDEVARLNAGQQLYVSPTVDYVPLNYPPLYFQASAALTPMLGTGFAAQRLISGLAAAGLLVLLGLYVARETGRRTAGVIAAGTFAAGHRLAESWFAVGRADSLYFALLFAGVFVHRRGGDRWTAVAAGLLWSLAFLTKQSALVVLAPLLAWISIRGGSRGRIATVTFALTSVAAVAWLDAAHEGWFLYYAFAIPRRFPLDWSLAPRFLLDVAPLAPALALGVWGSGARARIDAAGVAYHAALIVGLLASSWQLRLYPGAGFNVLLAACLAAALAAGLGWGWIAAAPMRRRMLAVASAVIVLQLAMHVNDPRGAFPLARDRAAGEDLIRRLRLPTGPVFVSSHPYLARVAGKPGHAHVAPLMDVVKGGNGPIETGLWRAVQDSMRARAWPVLVLDTEDWMFDVASEAGYRRVAAVFGEDDVFWPITGYRTRPEWVMVPEEQIAARR